MIQLMGLLRVPTCVACSIPARDRQQALSDRSTLKTICMAVIRAERLDDARSESVALVELARRLGHRDRPCRAFVAEVKLRWPDRYPPTKKSLPKQENSNAQNLPEG